MNETKKPWQSKTNWVALIVALVAFIPQVSSLIAANPQEFSALIGVVFIVLRQVSGGKISIK